MRRALVAISILVGALSLAPAAGAVIPAPAGHGADPVEVDRGPEAAAPSGGRDGKPLSGAARRRAAGIASASRLPTTWCGDERTSDDREHELANGEFRYHAVYAIAADGASRLRERANQIQTDAFQASALLEQQYGRAIRFDMGTNCGPQYLDITVVRLRKTTAELGSIASLHEATMNAVAGALADAGFQALGTTQSSNAHGLVATNFAVWLDAPGPPGACGQATIYDDPRRTEDNANNSGGKVALIFRNSSGFCSSNTVRHEIGHNLGALQPRAPHAFDGAHCDDAYEDTMCYSSAPQVAGGGRGLYFDWNNDDYWDPPSGPPLPWWTVNLSRFLCPDTTCNVPPGQPAPAPEPQPVAPVTDAPSAAERPYLYVRARRRGRVWRLTLRARGSGRARIAVRCRRRRGARVAKVYARRVELPRTTRARVRCSSRPVATLRSAAGAAKVRLPRRLGR